MATIPTASIRRREDQPRTVFKGIDQLAESIRENGLLQAITVRRVDDIFEIVAGERRFRAVQSLGWETIPAKVIDADDVLAFELAVLENTFREDMNPMDEARAIQRLLDYGLDPVDIERKIGRGWGNGVYVQWKTSYLTLCEPVQDLIAKGHLAEMKGWQLSKLSPNGQLSVMRAYQRTKMSDQQFTAAVEVTFASENQLDMFPETKASPKSRAAAKSFDSAMEMFGKALTMLDDLEPGDLALALRHRGTPVEANIDTVIDSLRRLRSKLQREDGRQRMMEELQDGTTDEAGGGVEEPNRRIRRRGALKAQSQPA